MYLRVDDRLVHGQVVTAWVRELKVKHIMVVDDGAASNKIISKALKMATPRGVTLRVVTTEEGASLVPKFTKQSMIICKYPLTAAALVKAHPDSAWTICVGNIGAAEGRKTYADTVHLDEENYNAVQEMLELDNVDIFMQTVPSQPVNHF